MHSTRTNTLIDTVNDEYRRHSLAILARNRMLTVNELATRLVRALTDERTPENVRQTQIELKHVHLPKLREVGLISYSHETWQIRLLEDAIDEISPLLDIFQSVESDETTKPVAGT